MEIREVVIGEGSVSLPGIVAVARRGVPVRIVGAPPSGDGWNAPGGWCTRPSRPMFPFTA